MLELIILKEFFKSEIFNKGAVGYRQQISLGSAARIQLNDATFSRKEVGEIQNFINAERLSKDEVEIPYMTTSIKADENVTMGIVTDVKTELRKINALKINYSTRKSNNKESN